MEQNKHKEKSTSLFGTLLAGAAGIAIGLGAKYLADELIFNNKIEEKVTDLQNKNKIENKYHDINENIETTTTTENGFDEYESFLCPISQEIMSDPVITPKGITYDKKSILNWLKNNSICPITKTPLQEKDLIVNYSLKNAIMEYLKKQNFKDI